MSNRFNQILLCASFSGLIATVLPQARAATFQNGEVRATADGTTSPVTFTTEPFVTAANSTASDASSTTTPDVTGLVFKGSFVQSVSSTSGSTSGLFEVVFTADAGDTYSLFGNTDATAGTGLLGVFLADESKETFPYLFSSSVDGPGELTADSTGGSMSGTLIGGDTYEFSLGESLNDSGITPSISVFTPAPPTLAALSGSGGITITPSLIPEPATPALILIGSGLFLLTVRKRRRRITGT